MSLLRLASGARSSSSRAPSCGSGYQLGDPQPHRFSVLSLEQRGRFTIARVNYPDATNYGGDKLMVYECSPSDIERAKTLDPHFLEKGLTPIARFEPTDRGLELARSLVKMLTEGPP